MFPFTRSRRPKAVAFDMLGTVFPLAPPRPQIEALGLPGAALEGWFAAGLRDAFALAATGDYRPFAKVLDAALDLTLAEQGLPPAPEDRRAALKRQLRRLPPRSEAGRAFDRLADKGVRVLALTNGSESATRTLLGRAGLLDKVDRIISTDEVELAKPRREVYVHAAARA